MQDKRAEEIRENAKRIAADYLERGDPMGWFDALYGEASGDNELVPWADLEPNRFFREWAESVGLEGKNRKSLVVGCGLGDEAKYLYDLGFRVTAFDVSEKAIEWAKKIHDDLDIKFSVADLFDPPKDWKKAFDFVVEVYTIQALPINLREKAIDYISSFVGKKGELVVVQRHRANDEEADGLPWALSPNDLSRFEKNGMRQISRNEYFGDEEEPIKRFVVKYIQD